jgi:Nup133 N terminal like
MRMCATPMSAVTAAACKLRSLIKSCPDSWVVCASTDAPGSLMQWPPLLRPLTQLSELPQPVLERYNAVQTVAFCGVFPEIRRAWASVDNELFLWRLDRWWGPSRLAAATTLLSASHEGPHRGTIANAYVRPSDLRSSTVPGTTCQ